MINKHNIRNKVLYPGYVHPSSTVSLLYYNAIKSVKIEDLYNLILAENDGKGIKQLANNTILVSNNKNIAIYDSFYRDYVKLIEIQKSKTKFNFDKLYVYYKTNSDDNINTVQILINGDIFVPTKNKGVTSIQSLDSEDILLISDKFIDTEYMNCDDIFTKSLGNIVVSYMKKIENDSENKLSKGYRLRTLSGNFDLDSIFNMYDCTFLE